MSSFSVLSRLMTAEERLREEQMKREELPTIMAQKDQIIDQQEQQIKSLNDANNRLIEALNHLKERYRGNSSQNGHIPTTTAAKMALAEANGQFRSSDC